jgi:chemosensory pili system protein ChpC
MEKQIEQMRGVLITMQGGKLLLPNTAVSEIISYLPPETVEDKPSWFLGAIRWKGYRLPLIAFSKMAQWNEQTTTAGSKVAIVKALSGHERLPYFAFLTAGFPRLVNISSDQLIDDPEHESEYYYSANLDSDTISIPNLEKIEQLILEHI